MQTAGIFTAPQDLEAVAHAGCCRRELPWQWLKIKQLIRKSGLWANELLHKAAALKLSDSTESSVCLRTRIKSCDPADGLCRSKNMRHRDSRLQGSNRSNSHVFAHDCSHTWLSGWLDYAHVHTCDWRSALKETHTREVFMPERDYVLWKGNLPWRGRTLLSEYNNSTGKSVGGTNTEMYQKVTPLW